MATAEVLIYEADFSVTHSSSVTCIYFLRSEASSAQSRPFMDMLPFNTISLAFFVCVFHQSLCNDRANLQGKHQVKLLSRASRTLVYPKASDLLLIFGLGTPLQLDRESVIVGAFTKFLYSLPTNSTDFTESGIYFKRNSGKTRWTIYKVLESIANVYGLGGKACLLRAICEVAFTPFDFNHGLFGQLLQTLLTPSSTSEPYDDPQDQEYHAAEKLGRHVGQSCHALYPECQRSALDVFSTTDIQRATRP